MPFLATAERACGLVPRGAVDDLRIDAGLHGLEHVAAGQVDGRGLLEGQVELGLVGGDDRLDHQGHVAAGQVVGFEALAGDPFGVAQSGLHGHDLRADDHLRVDLAERHPQEVEDPDPRPGRLRLDPEAEVANEDRQRDDADDQRPLTIDDQA